MSRLYTVRIVSDEHTYYEVHASSPRTAIAEALELARVVGVLVQAAGGAK